MMVLRWQHELEGKLSHSGVMACRSILLRILEAARKERLITTTPVREVEAPKPRLDPEQVFGHRQGPRPTQTQDVDAIAQAVRMLGGEYYFMPSRAFLRSL